MDVTDILLSNVTLVFAFIIVIYIVATMIRVNNEWNESLILRFGKFNRIVGGGLYFITPIIDTAIKIDKRVTTIELAKQSVITKDNISVNIDAVAFIKITDTKKSIIGVQNYRNAVDLFAQTTLRNVLGQMTLDELLAKRHEAADRIKDDLDKAASDWGIDIIRLELLDIQVPEDMKRIMARQAEAEREKRGVIIAAEGELEASKNLAQASNILAGTQYGFELRVLATISDVSQDQSNTIVFYPTHALDASIAAGLAAKKDPK